MTRWLAALPGLPVVAGCGNAEERPKKATAVEPTGGRSSVHRGQGGAAGSTGVSQGGVGQDAGAGQGASYGKGGDASVPEGGSPEQAAGSDSGSGGSPADSSLFAPELAIQSPESVAEFEEQSLVTTIGNLEVVCRAARAAHPNAREVDSSTIGIVLIDADDTVHTAVAVTPSDENEDEYTTSFAIGPGFAAGRAEIRCTAEASSSPPASAPWCSTRIGVSGPSIRSSSIRPAPSLARSFSCR